jgi:UPF0755 protein
LRVVKFFFFLIVVACAVGAVGAYFALTPYGPSVETFVDIAPGTGTAEIARQLQNEGIVRNRFVFEAVKLKKGGNLKAGVYRFDHPVTVSEVYERMHRGDVYTRTVLIPEGFNIFDIAQAVAAAGLGGAQDFLAAEEKDTELIARWIPADGSKPSSLEGYLFPDTYKFSPHATPEMMLAVMVKRFGQQAQRLGLQDGDAARVVTMASLVEKEVRVDAERPTVAGVFENRLAAGMPLQTDPTVIYASLLQGTWTGVIHQSELHSDSAYNTYAHAGLPPGPICNPGVAALKAAMHPVKTDFMYFEANPDGSTKFAKTMEEHSGDVAGYRKATGEVAEVVVPKKVAKKKVEARKRKR